MPPPAEEGAPAAPVAYTRYEEQLYFMSDALQAYFDNPTVRGELMTKLHEARVEVRSLIDRQTVGWRPVFEVLLWPPVKGAAVSSSAAVGRTVASGWCQDVYAPFQQDIAGYYPFNPSGHDLPFEALTTFYKPSGGLLTTFTREVLGDSVRKEGQRYSFSRQLGADRGSLFKKSLLQFLERASDLSEAFFPARSEEPRIDLEVLIHPSPLVHTTALVIGGRSVDYHNGPERWHPLTWPGSDPHAGAFIQVRGANGMHERVNQDGVWGLYRLIEAGTVTRTSATVFSVAWQLRTHDVIVRMDFRPKRAESPFFPRAGSGRTLSFLSPVRERAGHPPAQILKSGTPCSAGTSAP